MKSFIVAAAIVVAAISGASAQFTINPNGTITCAASDPNGDFCAGASLSTNIIIRCTSGVGQAGNCNDNLAGVPPVGVKDFAPCFQSSPTAGDAVCSFNGIGYPSNGSASFPLPGTNTTATTTVTVTSTSTSSVPVVTSTLVSGNATVTVGTPTGTGSVQPTISSFKGAASGNAVGFGGLIGFLVAVGVVGGVI
ncbi:MAG: hypothetical protein MMC33_007447 [Icmadophila ericetorum]|nr:hypothetical protein [Icmadophila ericetorum]